jgi:putative DNA primase/helicase
MWSWLIDCFDIAPRMAVLSPEKQCGKTILLTLLSHLTPRPLMASNITPSAIFRTVEAARPTLLIDEADTFTQENEALRGILNSGHTRASATIIRTVGDDFTPRSFSTWCPMVLAAIGSLPGTVEDRSIIIRMQRKAPGESFEPLPQSGKRAAALRSELQILAQKIKRWTTDNGQTLADLEPPVPGGLRDRASDNWRPLLAIADQIGGHWPEQSRKAATDVSGGFHSDNESAKVQLLLDIRTLFSKNGWERITSQALCDELSAMEECPWSDWKKGKPISQAQLARLLRPFGVTSRDLKQPSGQVLKGYLADDFIGSFSRYLPPDPNIPLSERYVATFHSQSSESTLLHSATEAPGSVLKNARIHAPVAKSSTVADRTLEIEPEEVTLW